MTVSLLTIGSGLMLLALVASACGAVAAVVGAALKLKRWSRFSRVSVFILAGSSLCAFVLLEIAFVRCDFRHLLVAAHSSSTTPPFYRATAIWASQSGSLLLWLTLLSLWIVALALATRKRTFAGVPYALATLLGIACFFCALMVFLEPPFKAANPVPPEGVGLNPLLRHPSMMFHPPLLYSGYTLFAVPMALAFGALITRSVGIQWLRCTRPFAFAAWMALGVGIVLGARWSYAELGWGGYWAWDAVENASLMPWLCGTAYLHSAMIQEKRGMLKTWNISLVMATGILAVLSTFVVRSGLLNSIHAFGASTLGVPFLCLIITLIVLAVVLVIYRLGALHSEARFESIFSREAAFLFNNLVLVGMCFVVFWGTFFPLISEAVTGEKASVGPPWFSRYTVPLALVLTLLAGIGPVLAWRRVTMAKIRRMLVFPLACGAVTFAVLVLSDAIRAKPTALAMFSLASFVLAVVAQELWRGVAARRVSASESRARALIQLVARNRRRYGGYLVHVGIAVIFCGIAGSSAFQKVRDVKLNVGQTARVGEHEVKYLRPTAELRAAKNGRLERIDLGAVLELRRNGRHVATLSPKRSYFPSSSPALGFVSRYFSGEATSEVALQAGLLRDAWTAVAPDTSRLDKKVKEGDRVFAGAKSLGDEEKSKALALALSGLVASYTRDAPPANFRLLISPLVSWIWLGGIVAGIGALVAICPSRRRLRSDQLSKVGVDLSTELRLAEVAASSEAKLHQIHDAELDRQVGKLSAEDWEIVDDELRVEAVDLLRELDEIEKATVTAKTDALPTKGSPIR